MDTREDDTNENRNGHLNFEREDSPQEEFPREGSPQDLLELISEAGSERAAEICMEARDGGAEKAAKDFARLVENTLLTERKAPNRGAESVISKVFEATVMGTMNNEETARSLRSVSKADLVGAIRHMLDEYVSKKNVKGLLDALKERGSWVPIEGIKEVLHERLKYDEKEGDYIVTLRSFTVDSFLVEEEDASSVVEAAQIAEDGVAHTYGLWPAHPLPEEGTYTVEVVGGETHSVSADKIEPQEPV